MDYTEFNNKSWELTYWDSQSDVNRRVHLRVGTVIKDLESDIYQQVHNMIAEPIINFEERGALNELWTNQNEN